MRKTLQRSFKELLLTLPSFGWLCFFFVIPAWIVYMCAFRVADADGGVLPLWSLDSILSLFDSHAIAVTIRTVALATATSLICVVVAIPVSYYIATLPKSRQPKILFFVVIPLWTSFLVRIFAWKVLLHPDGLVKSLLISMHLVNESTSLLYNNAAVLLVMCTSYLPFAILPIYSAASKFNFQLFEAAMDLGATKRKAFFSVFLPGIKPAMLTASLMVLIPAAGAYVIPEVVGGRGTMMLGNMIAQRVFVDRNLPDASAIALLLSVVIFIPAIIITLLRESFQNLRQKKGV